jgi:hypothetical protein
MLAVALQPTRNKVNTTSENILMGMVQVLFQQFFWGRPEYSGFLPVSSTAAGQRFLAYTFEDVIYQKDWSFLTLIKDRYTG